MASIKSRKKIRTWTKNICFGWYSNDLWSKMTIWSRQTRWLHYFVSNSDLIIIRQNVKFWRKKSSLVCGTVNMPSRVFILFVFVTSCHLGIQTHTSVYMLCNYTQREVSECIVWSGLFQLSICFKFQWNIIFLLNWITDKLSTFWF